MKSSIILSFVFVVLGIVNMADTETPAIIDTSSSETLCDAVDSCNLTWSTDGPAHWFSQTETFIFGNDAARSGSIGNNETTNLWTTVTGPGVLKFQWQVSSELYYDTLSFYIDGELQTNISGTTSWAPLEYTIPDGSHILKWQYSKDYCCFTGSDCGWVDQVEYAPKPAIALSHTQLAFGAAPGTTVGARTFSISNNDGTSTLNWAVTVDQNWLSAVPNSGTSSGIDSSVVTVSIDTSGLSTGIYRGTILVSASDAFNSPQKVSVTLKIYSAGGSSVPFGHYATPTDGATISSSVPFTGWALDDVGVKNVKLFRLQDHSPVYIGDAVLVEGARPDVELAYPNYPNNHKAGWGYMMLTNFLPNRGNGTFVIEAIAEDFEGQRVSLGAKTVIVDNINAVKPFGAIDMPAQGGTASGSDYRNTGWVLTPPPNIISTSGNTISVYVDGVFLGHPTYNIFREDIADLFPDYNNSNGAHGFFDFDSTAFQDGVHTIVWSATDNASNTDGIGSRYFLIRNSAGNRAQATHSITHSLEPILKRAKPAAIRPLGFVKEYRDDVEWRLIFPDHKGIVNVEIKELQRFKLDLGQAQILSGGMMVGDQLKPLPTGSTLDRRRGIFYWQTGVGFCGDYRLVFVETDTHGNMTYRTVLVRIAPRF